MTRRMMQLGILVAMLSSAVVASAAPAPAPAKPPVRKCVKKKGVYVDPYACSPEPPARKVRKRGTQVTPYTGPLEPPPMTKEEKRRYDVERRLKHLERKVRLAERKAKFTKERKLRHLERQARLAKERAKKLANPPILKSLELELGAIPATNRGGFGGLTAVTFTFGSMEMFTWGLRLSARILTDTMEIYDPTNLDIAGSVPAYYTDFAATGFVTAHLSRYLFVELECGFGFRWVHVPKETAMIHHGPFQETLPRKAFNEVYGVLKIGAALGFKLGRATMKMRYTVDTAFAKSTKSLQPSGDAWLKEDMPPVWTHVLSLEFSFEWRWHHPQGK